MKDKKLFNRLIIYLGVVAIIGLRFTPAFAEGFRTGGGVEDDSMIQDALEDFQNADDSFGQNYQYAWIPRSAFVGYNSNTAYAETGNYIYFTSSSNAVMRAPVNLPSGVYLYAAQLFFYDSNASYNIGMTLYREYFNDSRLNIGSCISTGSPGYSVCSAFPDHTIRNGDSMYTVYVGGASTSGTSIRFAGVRLMFRRQIRTGLSHPFTDIGSLPSAFQDAIAALYRSGITSGTSATTYGPNNPVTRAQMAVFLSKALGLYWGYPY